MHDLGLIAVEEGILSYYSWLVLCSNIEQETCSSELECSQLTSIWLIDIRGSSPVGVNQRNWSWWLFRPSALRFVLRRMRNHLRCFTYSDRVAITFRAPIGIRRPLRLLVVPTAHWALCGFQVRPNLAGRHHFVPHPYQGSMRCSRGSGMQITFIDANVLCLFDKLFISFQEFMHTDIVCW